MAKNLITFGVLLVVAKVSSQGNLCGLAAPDPGKTCVTIRLPWQPEPIHFCIDKESFRYRSRCGFNSGGCNHNVLARNDTLVVAAPWDCCPHTSYPDVCPKHNAACPMPPLNRKCQVVGHWDGDCCPRYWCEEGITPEQGCGSKRLEPICSSPPPDKMKMNCVGFKDPHGCCPKWQCDGDAGMKPGLCPAQSTVMQYQMRLNQSQAHWMNMTGMGPSGRSQNMMSGNMMCVGDFNCAGDMKCCSHDAGIYLNAMRMSMNTNANMNMNMGGQHYYATHGYCMDPVMMQAINKT